ncbi:MAG: UbiA family prenyltransferase [Gammaproteobacteria bacterium]|nr:UbiA family prenyltransferase [Gammaproteobacteria bacterium]
MQKEYSQKKLPLCVDLDGTLLNTDMLYESVLRLLKKNIFYLFLLPLWLVRGRGRLKYEISRRIEQDIDVRHLPCQQAFLDFLHQEKAKHTPLILVTASDERIARKIADRLGIFDEVIGSDGRNNLKGARKGDLLAERFGERGFVYAGNAVSDLAVWRRAAAAIAVNASENLANRAAAPVICRFPAPGKPWWHYLPKAMRLHQWVKNLLIFVPVLAAHKFTDLSLLLSVTLAFFAFSLTASSAYILNDLLDLEADRCHANKRHRPFAAGTIPILYGLLLIPTTLGAGILVAQWLPGQFILVLGLYYALTLAYSSYLKQIVLVDALCLGVLYTVRIIAGSAVINIYLSHWLLAFSVFIFLCLAFVKRYAEVQQLRKTNQSKIHSRGYQAEDLEILADIGVSSGHIAVLVLALYINSPEVRELYATPGFLWGVNLLLLYWLNRMWLITHRGHMHDDPIVFTLRDKLSYLVGLGIIWVAALAKYYPL